VEEKELVENLYKPLSKFKVKNGNYTTSNSKDELKNSFNVEQSKKKQ